MTPLDWFKKEKPLLGLLGSGGGGAFTGAASADPVTVRYLLVGGGGGGGGGQGGRGGGAGGVRYATLEIPGGEAHPYQVGDGGAGQPSSSFPTGPLYGRGATGTDSFFTDPTVNAGGGGGGGWQQVGPPGSLDHGANGNPLGGGGGGGGQDGPWTTISPGGTGGTNGNPEVNHPLGSTYDGGTGYGGPGSGSGNRGGGGGGSGQEGGGAQHGGPDAGGPTQNPGSGQVGGNGGIGTQIPTAYIPSDGRTAMIPASTANSADQLYVYRPTVGYSMPAPENFFGAKVPTCPYPYQRYWGSGGGGGSETARGGYGAGAPGWTNSNNYGGGGPAAGGGTNDPASGANGVPGINGRGGGGGGGGPGGNIAPGKNPASPTGSWSNQGHAGGSGILIVQYPDDRTLTRSQPTYTSDISGPGPEGYKYFVAIGPAGASKGYNWPHPGTGTVQWD